MRWWVVVLAASTVGLAPQVKPPARLPSYGELEAPRGDGPTLCLEHSQPVVRKAVLRGLNAGREYYGCGNEIPCAHFAWCRDEVSAVVVEERGVPVVEEVEGPRLAGTEAQAARGVGEVVVALGAEWLNGTVARILYRSPTSGFTVARIRPRYFDVASEEGRKKSGEQKTGDMMMMKKKDGDSSESSSSKNREITVGVKATSCLATARVGDDVRLSGEWTRHPRYGKQFEAGVCFDGDDESKGSGFLLWLSSGVVPHVGRATAKKVVEALGDRAEEWLARLGSATKVGADDVEAREAITRASLPWDATTKMALLVAEHASSRAIVVRLVDEEGLEIDAAFALEKVFGTRASAEFRRDPWGALLAAPGWGFRRADAVALKRQGELPNDPRRLRHGLVHALSETASSGHCAQTRQDLLGLASHDLGPLAAQNYTPSINDLEIALEAALASGRLRQVEDDEQQLCLTPWLDNAERIIAETIAERLVDEGKDSFPVVKKKTTTSLLKSRAGHLSPEQRLAVERATSERLLIVAGGPGTGKTHAAREAVAIWKERGLRVALASPTARGAAALGAAVGDRASTLHRLLEWNAWEGAFARNAERPLEVDVVVVDEVSMLDVPLAAKFCAALPQTATVLLIGDPDQLPAVGPGALLRDLLSCPEMPRVSLKTIFRTATRKADADLGLDASDIAVTAREVNQGASPSRFRDFLEMRGGKNHDEIIVPEGTVFLDTGATGDAARLAIVETVRRLARAGFDPLADIQVLAPMKRGNAGVDVLNGALQDLVHDLNEGKNDHHQKNNNQQQQQQLTNNGKKSVRVGDRVIQLSNDYDIGVFNGDVGIVDDLNRNGSFVAKFHIGTRGWARVMYAPNDVGDVVALAYCLTVHKAQGNEYPVIVMPIVPEASFMLTRPLLYTAISRAKKLLVLVGSRKLLDAGVKKSSSPGTTARVTAMVPRLRTIIQHSKDRNSYHQTPLTTTTTHQATTRPSSPLLPSMAARHHNTMANDTTPSRLIAP